MSEAPNAQRDFLSFNNASEKISIKNFPLNNSSKRNNKKKQVAFIASVNCIAISYAQLATRQS